MAEQFSMTGETRKARLLVLFALAAQATPAESLLLGTAVAIEPPRSEEWRGPGRDRWQMPAEVLTALELRKGNVVADIGAGIGYFTVRFAKAVGPRGRVDAVDINSRVLAYLKDQAQKQNLTNVNIILSRVHDPLLPPKSVDLAFLCETVHEITDRVAFYRKVRGALKDNGRMAVIESLPAPRTTAPPEHWEEGRISRDLTVREAEQAGFRLIREPKFLARQYFLIFRRSK
jgi:arsenite methyltransferase